MLYERGGYGRTETPPPMPRNIVEQLEEHYGKENSKAFSDALNDLFKKFSNLPQFWIYHGVLDLASPQHIPMGLFRRDKVTLKKLIKFKKELDWVKNHFQKGSSFKDDDSVIKHDIHQLFEIFEKLIEQQLPPIKSVLKNKRRGPKPNLYYRTNLLALLLDLILDGPMGANEAYSMIAYLLEKLTGEKVDLIKKVAALRALATEEINRISKLRPPPK